MLKELFYSVYYMPIPVLIAVTLILLGAGIVLHFALRGSARRITGVAGSVFSLWLVIYATLLSRVESAGAVILTPGYSFIKALTSPQYMRMVLMNIFLFIPLGIFFSLAFEREKTGKTVLISLAFGLAIIIFIEAAQFLFGLGCAETDDVICNLAGCAAGMTPCVIAGIFGRSRRNNE